LIGQPRLESRSRAQWPLSQEYLGEKDGVTRQPLPSLGKMLSSITYDESLATQSASRPLIALAYRRCAWCGKPIVGRSFDRHHWLVKRGELPKSRFDDIDVVVNVVALHHSCHSEWGQTREMEERCREYVASLFGEEVINKFKEAL